MPMQNFTKLIAIARREAGAMLAEDVVQDALLVAIEQGRADLEDQANLRWLSGVWCATRPA